MLNLLKSIQIIYSLQNWTENFQLHLPEEDVENQTEFTLQKSEIYAQHRELLQKFAKFLEYENICMIIYFFLIPCYFIIP